MKRLDHLLIALGIKAEPPPHACQMPLQVIKFTETKHPAVPVTVNGLEGIAEPMTVAMDLQAVVRTFIDGPNKPYWLEAGDKFVLEITPSKYLIGES